MFEKHIQIEKYAIFSKIDKICQKYAFKMFVFELYRMYF